MTVRDHGSLRGPSLKLRTLCVQFTITLREPVMHCLHQLKHVSMGMVAGHIRMEVFPFAFDRIVVEAVWR